MNLAKKEWILERCTRAIDAMMADTNCAEVALEMPPEHQDRLGKSLGAYMTHLADGLEAAGVNTWPDGPKPAFE